MNFHVFDMKHFKNKKEKDLLNGLEVFNPDAIVMAHTVQKLIVISNKFLRAFDSIFLSYVIDAY